MSASFLAAASLYLLLLTSSPPYARAKVSFTQLREEKESAVKELTEFVREQLEKSNWCRSGNFCNEGECALFDCAGDIGKEAACQSDVISSCTCSKNNNLNVTDRCPVQSLNNELCADVDPSDALNKGQLLNSERPTFRTPKGAVSTTGDGDNITITDEFLRRDVCSLKKIDNEIRDIYQRNNLTAWFYSGTENGAFMTFPGHLLCRDEGSDKPALSCDYNPTFRPWYITAATGDRDVVFVYDRTLARSSTLSQAFLDVLNAMDYRDAVAMRLFDDGADTDNVLGDDDDFDLRFLDVGVRTRIAGALPRTGLSKPSNVTAALGAAFSVLRKTAASTECSRFIVMLVGAEDACFGRCRIGGGCTCVSDVVSFVEAEQARLEAAGGRRATILAFTDAADGVDAADVSRMERMAASVACPSGMWHGVSGNDTTQSAMRAFVQFSSLLQYDDSVEPEVFGTDVYQDASGLGEMLTLSSPVYDFNGRRLVSVVGLDILFSEVVNRTGLSPASAREEIRKYSRQSRECRADSDFDSCDAQALRANHRNSRVCPPPALRAPDMCYEFRGRFYARGTAPARFDDARAACERGGGTLAVIGGADEQVAVGALVSADGSWIGLRNGGGTGGSGGNRDYVWEDGRPLGEWNQFARALPDDADQCVTADRRGMLGNWDFEACASLREYVCEYAERGSPSPSPSKNTTAKTTAGTLCGPSTSVQAIELQTCNLDRVQERICDDVSDDGIGKANPLCANRGSNFSEADRFCCGGRADPRYQDDAGPAARTGVIVGACVAAVVVVLAVVAVVKLRPGARRIQRISSSGDMSDASSGGDVVKADGDAVKAGGNSVKAGGDAIRSDNGTEAEVQIAGERAVGRPVGGAGAGPGVRVAPRPDRRRDDSFSKTTTDFPV